MATKARVPVFDNKQTAKQLAIVIYDFLLEERCKKTHVTKKAKQNIDRAVDCLEKVYRIKFTDYVMLKFLHPLQEVFAVGYHPVKVKNRIAAETHKRKGNDFMDSLFYNFAEVEYTRAIQLNPRNAIYFCNRAASRIRQRAFLPAISDCSKALALDKSYTKAHLWLGLAHVMTDHPAKAIRCYRKALRIEPDNEICIANMDLINKKFNRTSFKLLQPLYRCSRSLARMAASMAKKQVPFRRKNGDNGEPKETEIKQLNFEKYTLGTLD